jgi:hypothetical protein
MVAGDTKAEALRYRRELEDRLERNWGASIRTKKVPFSFVCDEYLKTQPEPDEWKATSQESMPISLSSVLFDVV